MLPGFAFCLPVSFTVFLQMRMYLKAHQPDTFRRICSYYKHRYICISGDRDSVFDDGDSTSSYSSAAATSCTRLISHRILPVIAYLQIILRHLLPDSDSAFSLPTSSVTYQIGEENPSTAQTVPGKLTYVSASENTAISGWTKR